MTSTLANLAFLAQAHADDATASESKSGISSILNSMDPDIMSAIVILGLIFSFVIAIVSIIAILGTYQKVTISKMTNELVRDLLEKGYNAEEIAKVVHGPSGWDRVGNLFKRKSNPQIYKNRPVPPVKQSV